MSKVTFITASYNYAKYIKETIESVINQTVQDWEMIIVDDGSTDNSVEVIKSYCEKDNRIKLYQHENGVNKGLAETIKLGIKLAKIGVHFIPTILAAKMAYKSQRRKLK